MKLMRSLRRFGKATGGLAALEFAILVPMMVLILFGSVDVIDMLGANRRAQNVAASLADVVARDTEVSNQEITGLWTAANVLLFPSAPANMQMRITSISIVDASTARVVWSEGHGGMAPRTTNATIALPTAMMQPGTSVIFTETVFTYRSPLGIVLSAPITMRHNAYRRSRLIDPIPRVA